MDRWLHRIAIVNRGEDGEADDRTPEVIGVEDEDRTCASVAGRPRRGTWMEYLHREYTTYAHVMPRDDDRVRSVVDASLGVLPRTG